MTTGEIIENRMDDLKSANIENFKKVFIYKIFTCYPMYRIIELPNFGGCMIFAVASFDTHQGEQYFNWLIDNHHQLDGVDLKSLFSFEFTKTNTFKELGSPLLEKYISASLDYILKNLIDVHHGKIRWHDGFDYDSDKVNRYDAQMFMRSLSQHKSFTASHAEMTFEFFKKYYYLTATGSLNTKLDDDWQYNNLSSGFVEFVLEKQFTSERIEVLFKGIFLKLKDECLAAKPHDLLSACALPSVIIGFSKLLQKTAGALVHCGDEIASLVSHLNSSVSHLEQSAYASHNALKNHLHYHMQASLAVLNDDRCLHSIMQTVRSEHRPAAKGNNFRHLFREKNIRELDEIADEMCVLHKYDIADKVTLMQITALVQKTALTEVDIDKLISKFKSGPIDSCSAFYTAVLSKKDIPDNFKSQVLIDGFDEGHLVQMPYSFGKNAHLSFGVIYDALNYLHSKPLRFNDNIQTNIGRLIMEMQPTSNENYIKLFDKIDAICNHEYFFVSQGKNPDFLRRQAALRIITDVYYPSLFSSEEHQANMSLNVLSHCFDQITIADCELIGSNNLNDLILQLESLKPDSIKSHHSATAELITSHILNEKVNAIGALCPSSTTKPKGFI